MITDAHGQALIGQGHPRMPTRHHTQLSSGLAVQSNYPGASLNALNWHQKPDFVSLLNQQFDEDDSVAVARGTIKPDGAESNFCQSNGYISIARGPTGTSG